MNLTPSLAGWVILQAGNDAVPDIKTENSRLILQMDSPYTWVYALYGAQDYDNIRIDTKFVNQAVQSILHRLDLPLQRNGWLARIQRLHRWNL